MSIVKYWCVSSVLTSVSTRDLGYITKDKEPIMPPGMREHLKEDLDKSFDF